MLCLFHLLLLRAFFYIPIYLADLFPPCRYQIFERAEGIAQRTADFLARFFQKSVSKHLHPKDRDSHDDQPSLRVVYGALISANLVDSNDGESVSGCEVLQK